MVLATCTLLVTTLAAQDAAPAPPPPADQPVDPLAELHSAGKPTAEILARLLPSIADPAHRNRIRTEVLGLDPFPAAALVALLDADALAVRLGALELLEEQAGGDFGFNPWTSPATPENEGPLARWKRWSDDGAGRSGKPGQLLADEQRRGYLRDLLGNDADKSARARRMLEADGLASVGYLETYLSSADTLPPGGRAKVREAQYQIVLSRALEQQSAATARHLACGSRDQTLAALGTLKQAGLSALPILRDFLEHSDPLIRETAIDAILAIGGTNALPLVEPVLKHEQDINVIHGALRRLKDIQGERSQALAAAFLDREDEDLLVSAIQTCLSLSGDARPSPSRSFSSSRFSSGSGSTENKTLDPGVIAKLDDPRWRVRTAALEYVIARRTKAAGDRVLKLIDDEDEFVRFRAIKAAANLGLSQAREKFRRIFLDNQDMVGPVLEGYAELGLKPDAEMLAKLQGYPPDARLAAIDAAKNHDGLASLAKTLATDPDLDVACAALRFLGADADRVADPETATILLHALRSGSEEKRSAVIDRLDLPSNTAIDPVVMKGLERFLERPANTTLDPLYNAFLEPGGGDAAASPARAVTIVPGAAGELVAGVSSIAEAGGEQAFAASLCLARANHGIGFTVLLKQLPALDTGRKAAIADRLDEPKVREALDLLTTLLRDPLGEIRSQAAEAALSSDKAPAFIELVFNELSRPGTLLQPHEAYSYRLESAARDQRTGRIARGWAGEVLGDPDAEPAQTILALIILRHRLSSTQAKDLFTLARGSGNQWVRRAAWFSLGTARSPLFRNQIAELSKDPSPWVRAVLPELLRLADSNWNHHFDDTHSARNSSWGVSSSDKRIRLSDEEQALLEAMAATDPVPDNRFAASFTLLTHGKPIDAATFAGLLARQSEESRASYQVADWMHDNLKRLGPGLAPVVSALKPSEVNPRVLQAILTAVAPDAGSGFATFASLVKTQTSGEAQIVGPDSDVDDPAATATRESLLVVFFVKPGCKECAHVRQLLDSAANEFPGLKVVEHSVIESSGTILNQALSQRFGVPSAKHTVAPALFAQGGFLITNEITPPALGKLLADTFDLPLDDSWSIIDQPAIAAAERKVDERFEALTIPVVLIAGLLDGVNPCAFATIIFFLSYLQIARRSPREMLMVGAAFILAVFLAYLATGLVLHRILEELTSRFAGVQIWANRLFGGLALVAALLSFHDARKARQGRLDEMTLQLPGMLKDRIRGVIRTGARAHRFVIAAFLAGIIISFLELACTGQVYAPIIYQIQQGRADAVAMLLLYNLAFVLPLVVIFLLAWAGLRSDALIAFQKRYTAAVKIGLGLLFLFLAAFIFFGNRLFPH